MLHKTIQKTTTTCGSSHSLRTTQLTYSKHRVLKTNLDVSGVNHAPVPPFGTTSSSFFASFLFLPGYRYRRCSRSSAVAVANLRGLPIRAVVDVGPLPCLPVLAVLLLSAAVERAVAGILSEPIVAVNKTAQVLTLERVFRSVVGTYSRAPPARETCERRDGNFEGELSCRILVSILFSTIKTKGWRGRHFYVGRGARQLDDFPSVSVGFVSPHTAAAGTRGDWAKRNRLTASCVISAVNLPTLTPILRIKYCAATAVCASYIGWVLNSPLRAPRPPSEAATRLVHPLVHWKPTRFHFHHHYRSRHRRRPSSPLLLPLKPRAKADCPCRTPCPSTRWTAAPPRCEAHLPFPGAPHLFARVSSSKGYQRVRVTEQGWRGRNRAWGFQDAQVSYHGIYHLCRWFPWDGQQFQSLSLSFPQSLSLSFPRSAPHPPQREKKKTA